MISQVSQLFPGGSDIIGWVLQIAWLGFFVFFMFYGQRFQMTVMLRDVEKHLHRLKFIRDEGRKLTMETIKEIGKPPEDPTERVDQFLEYIAITPQSMDPSGIVWKLDHLLDVRDVRFKDEVKLMAPEADEVQLNNLENTLEAAMALHIIYKVIRHFYILGKKTLSLYIIMQLQMVLPLIMKEAEAFASALKAFATGQPIGDGAGALVAAKLMHGHKTRKIAKDIVAATVPLEGRIAHVLKSEGPGGTVGKPGDGIIKIINETKGKIATIVMIDAAQKLEGEKPGDVAEGVGAAIGGPGVDQFKIEESVLKYKIPVNAVIIKQDIGDAVSPMRKEVFDAADTAIQRIKRLLLERTKEGDVVIIAGIGNTIGIGQ
ncbi:MAG: DUF1512 domain-containing protein [Candidatus Bathyarchaeota archaeon]|nr:DUF1512 domain-containing protein [Candidatus Bathyarchaeota archaeon]MDH5623050.1 DUF1512 domain-containing protein [Candidatus Bathyarchaeota archaeon]MDH5635362.1 DUF1512 domain-containing protein [Candidatus Bathyarchaeota archaeon]MDH5701177.1 DUF1512 domain-containing protein [Candidatus Bathyarchaeota archaeon]